LLADGHKVRTTVRNLARESEVRAMLKTGGRETGEELKFFASDLEKDAGWQEAVAGCDYVLHVASPFPAGAPKDENELVVPARDGALRVLRAARDADVKRVVLTSSFAAIGYGRHSGDAPFTERDWTESDATNPPYIRSKAIAERAAWDFVAKQGDKLERSAINPTGIFGPALVLGRPPGAFQRRDCQAGRYALRRSSEDKQLKWRPISESGAIRPARRPFACSAGGLDRARKRSWLRGKA
jgi:dihydroflavonol-4-reductase